MSSSSVSVPDLLKLNFVNYQSESLCQSTLDLLFDLRIDPLHIAKSLEEVLPPRPTLSIDSYLEKHCSLPGLFWLEWLKNKNPQSIRGVEFRRLKQGTGHAGKWLAECLLIYCAVQFGKEKAGKRDDSGEICWKFVFCGWHVEIEHWSGMDLWIKIRSKQIDFDAGFSFDTRAVIDCALEAQKEEEEKCPCARCVNKIKPFLSCEFSECDLLHHEGCELGPYARALSKFAETDMFSRKEAINEFHRQFESEEHMRHYVRLTTALSKS